MVSFMKKLINIIWLAAVLYAVVNGSWLIAVALVAIGVTSFFVKKLLSLAVIVAIVYVIWQSGLLSVFM